MEDCGYFEFFWLSCMHKSFQKKKMVQNGSQMVEHGLEWVQNGSQEWPWEPQGVLGGPWGRSGAARGVLGSSLGGPFFMLLGGKYVTHTDVS